MTQAAQLDAIARDSIYATGCNGAMIRYSWSIARRHLPAGPATCKQPIQPLYARWIASASGPVVTGTNLHTLQFGCLPAFPP